MHREYFQLKKEPFPAHPDTKVFFPGGRRDKVLHHIFEDLSKGIPLIHLCGERGSGKTLLCQLLQEQIHLPHTVLLLSDPSATFDDMGRSLIKALGEKDSLQLAGDELYEKILHLISECAANNALTLLIIDDAEKLKPAVLMRMLRLIYDTHPQGGIQFILSGRLPLGADPELFTAIRAKPFQQFTYTLQPLDHDDTSRYLTFQLDAAGIPDNRQDNVFSAEAIARIHEATCGNIGLINILAEEALRNSCKANSSIVRLDHVKIPSELTTSSRIGISHPLRPAKTRSKKQLVFIVLVITAAISASTMMFLGTRPQQPIHESTDTISTPPSSIPEQTTEPIPVLAVPSPQSGTPSITEEADQIRPKQIPVETKTTKAEESNIILITVGKKLKVRHKLKGNINMPTETQKNVKLEGQSPLRNCTSRESEQESPG